MSLDRLLIHDITVLRAPVVTDRYGNDRADWPNATRTTVKGRLTRPAGERIVDGRDALVEQWVCYLPSDVVISGRDRIEFDGITFEMDGPPFPAYDAGSAHHIEARVRLAAG